MSDDLPAGGSDSEDVVEVPIDGVLDLHQFRPGDARDVVSDYLDACRERELLDVRIIHGKGKGVLRRIVHSLLEERSDVVSFRLASDSGSWGATLVRLVDTAGVERLASVADRSGGGSLPRYVVAAAVLALGIVAMGCGAAVEQGAEPDATVGAPAVEAVVLPDDDAGPEVTSLIGVPLLRPRLSDQRRAQLHDNLDAAVADYQADPDDEDAIIWYGRRLAYLSRYNDAIEVYSRGLESHPDSFKLLRHRGHRYISTRQLDAAVADFERAAVLAEGRAVEIEPDGAPNALDIPLSNVHFNIWYHRGLAYYLLGDFEAAREVFERILEGSSWAAFGYIAAEADLARGVAG